MSTAAACRIFIVLTVFLLISGGAFLHRTWFGTIGLAAPLTAFLSYNSVFTAGFLSYLFGIALVPWAVAAFIRLRARPLPVRLALGLAAGLLLMLAHLAAFALYAIIIAGLELQATYPLARTAPRAAVARLAWAALPLLLVVAALLLVSPIAHAPLGLPLAGGHPGLGLGSLMADLRYKVWILRRFLAGNEDLPLDYASIATAAVIALVLPALTRVRIAWPAALAMLLLGLAFVVAPDLTLGGAYLATRLPVPIAFFAVSCVCFAAPSARAQTRLVLLLFAITALHAAVVARDWGRYDGVERQFTSAFRRLAPARSCSSRSRRRPAWGCGRGMAAADQAHRLARHGGRWRLRARDLGQPDPADHSRAPAFADLYVFRARTRSRSPARRADGADPPDPPAHAIAPGCPGEARRLADLSDAA